MNIIVFVCLPTSPKGDWRRAYVTLRSGPCGPVLLESLYVGEVHHSCDHDTRCVYGDRGESIAEMLPESLGVDTCGILGHDPLRGVIPLF